VKTLRKMLMHTQEMKEMKEGEKTDNDAFEEIKEN
jgi:hypothetical protein